jgi:hypothetical protein
MVRLVSLFGLAFLTVAAVALMTPERKLVRLPAPEPERNDEAARSLSRLSSRVIPAYNVGFSLN